MNPIIMYENQLINAATIAVTSTFASAEYSKDNLYDYRPYTLWMASSSANQTITVTFSAAKTITSLGIINHNLSGCTLTLKKVIDEAESTVVTWVQSGNTPIFQYFTSQSAAEYRLYVSGASTSVFMGLLMLGTYITFPYAPDMRPYYPKEEGIVAENAISDKGMQLGAVLKYNPIDINITFKMITQSWVTSYFNPFWLHAKTLKPFLYAWDITNYPSDIYFVWVKPDSVHRAGKTYKDYVDEITISVQGVDL